MNNYICKIASYEELIKRWDYLIDIHNGSSKWIKFRDKIVKDYKANNIIYYIGILDGEIISEVTAYIKEDAFIDDISDYSNLLDDKMAYLAAFRVNKEYENKGYFSELFKYVIGDLKKMGYTYVSVGVESGEERNKNIYSHLGFTQLIKIIHEDEDIEFYKKVI